MSVAVADLIQLANQPFSSGLVAMKDQDSGRTQCEFRSIDEWEKNVGRELPAWTGLRRPSANIYIQTQYGCRYVSEPRGKVTVW